MYGAGPWLTVAVMFVRGSGGGHFFISSPGAKQLFGFAFRDPPAYSSIGMVLMRN